MRTQTTCKRPQQQRLHAGWSQSARPPTGTNTPGPPVHPPQGQSGVRHYCPPQWWPWATWAHKGRPIASMGLPTTLGLHPNPTWVHPKPCPTAMGPNPGNRTPQIMVDLVMVTNYCCKGVMAPWSGIGPNWLGWVRAKLGFC